MSEAPSIEAAYEMGAKGSPAVETERLAFEAWVRGHCWSLSADWDGKGYRGKEEGGSYICPWAMQTRRMWAAWRDRAALTPTPPAPAAAPADEFIDALAAALPFVEDAESDAGYKPGYASKVTKRLRALIEQHSTERTSDETNS